MAYNFLIVDDSSITRRVVRRAVTLSGLDIGDIHEAQDGVEAIGILDREWIDVVLADLNMPRMGGVALIGKMAENRLLDSTPVIVITSDRNAQRLAELKQRGVRTLINKPFRPETLRDVLRHVLGEEATGGRHGS